MYSMYIPCPQNRLHMNSFCGQYSETNLFRHVDTNIDPSLNLQFTLTNLQTRSGRNDPTNLQFTPTNLQTRRIRRYERTNSQFTTTNRQMITLTNQQTRRRRRYIWTYKSRNHTPNTRNEQTYKYTTNYTNKSANKSKKKVWSYKYTVHTNKSTNHISISANKEGIHGRTNLEITQKWKRKKRKRTNIRIYILYQQICKQEE